MKDNTIFQSNLVIDLILSKRNTFWKARACWVSAWQALMDLDMTLSSVWLSLPGKHCALWHACVWFPLVFCRTGEGTKPRHWEAAAGRALLPRQPRGTAQDQQGLHWPVGADLLWLHSLPWHLSWWAGENDCSGRWNRYGNSGSGSTDTEHCMSCHLLPSQIT